jgi:fructokinase
VSTPALERGHQRLAHLARPVPLAEIVRQANDGAAAARSALEDYVNRLGRGLAALCNLIDPDVIVLGGEGAALGLLYDQLPDAIAPYAIGDASAAVIVKAAHGDASIARGAAWLWPGTALARA